MPSNHLGSVTVVRETMDLKEYHSRRNPNTVVFNPKRGSCSLSKVHFDENTRNVVNKPHRPQSAFIISCRGPHSPPSPRKPAAKKPADKKRPQSAITYKQKYPEPKPKPEKKRPQSASTYKSSSSSEVSTVQEEPLSVSELTEDIEEISLGRRFYTRRVWRPKKKENGILQPPPPPPPFRQSCTGQLPKGDQDGKPHLTNGMAQFRWYKYPQTFHSYGQRVRRSKRFAPTLVGVPDCLKRSPQYGYSATRQSCRYKPFASVTSIAHHHRVESAALPHPLKEVATPPGPSPRIDLLPVELQHQEEEAEAIDNNGSYSFQHQETPRHDLTYTEDDYTTDQSRYRTYSETEQSTERSERPSSANNDDLYFLTRNLNGQDSNKNNANATVTDIEEVEEVKEVEYTTETQIEEIEEIEEELESKRGTPVKSPSTPRSDKQTTSRRSSVHSAKSNNYSYLVDVIEDGSEDGDVDDDVNFSDIPSIPSDVEDELDKLRSKNTANGRPTTAKFRSQNADSGDEAKPVSDEEI